MRNLFLLPFFFLALNANAQQLITVESGGTSTFYTDLDAALSAAPAGATVYLPGITYSKTSGSYVLRKQINLIGAGHYTDSSTVTGSTAINNAFYISPSANGTFMTGIQFIQGVYDSASNILSTRCNFNTGFDWTFPGNLNNLYFIECILNEVGNLYGSGGPLTANNIIIKNCIINTGVSNTQSNCKIENCLFLSKGYSIFYQTNGINVSNSIFLSNWGGSLNQLFLFSQNNTINNCIFTDSPSDSTYMFYQPNGNTQFQNIFGITLNQLFVNQSGNTFSYQHNYHLKTGSPALTAGVNGTQCGIYGGANPYKEGAVPYNPHISTGNIETSTSQNGNLKVNLKVIAQDR